MNIPPTPTEEQTSKHRRQAEAIQVAQIIDHYEKACGGRGIALKKAGIWVVRGHIRDLLKRRSIEEIISRMDDAFSSSSLIKGNYYELKGKI